MANVLQSEYSIEQCKIPRLLFTEVTYFDDRQRYYIVVAVSQRKQRKLMEAIGRMHSQNQPLPTWTVVCQTISNPLFIQPDCLRLKSSMELHQRDYLLFEQTSTDEPVDNPAMVPALERILEVDVGTQLDRMTWLGYWKPARRPVADLVQNCEDSEF